MNEVAVVETGRNVANVVENDTLEFVTFRIADQLFGVHVLKVQDILRPEDIAFVPLAPPEVKGSINLRGRIVTVIDVRVRLGLAENENLENNMGVTVEQKNELYTLLVDEIGEVLELDRKDSEQIPSSLDQVWREFAAELYKLETELMVVLDIDKLLRADN